MFDSWFIGIGGSILLLLTVAILYWLSEVNMISMMGYVIAASIFFLRSCVLRSGSPSNADVFNTRGMEENRGTLNILNDQFNWTLFFLIAATVWVVVDKVIPHFINKQFRIDWNPMIDNLSANVGKPTLTVVRNEEMRERKQA